MILLILCNFVTCCFDLIAYCNLALFMTNSTFNLTCAGDGSVNVYACMHVYMYYLQLVLRMCVAELFWAYGCNSSQVSWKNTDFMGFKNLCSCTRKYDYGCQIYRIF